jgi:hypothetical protein
MLSQPNSTSTQPNSSWSDYTTTTTHHPNTKGTSRQPRKLIFSVQPYFKKKDDLKKNRMEDNLKIKKRKMTLKKNGTQPQKK